MIDLTSQTVGRLTVMRRAPGSADERNRPCWFCLCECGATVRVRQDHLRSGQTRSCGCLRAEVAKTTKQPKRTEQGWQNRRARALLDQQEYRQLRAADECTICTAPALGKWACFDCRRAHAIKLNERRRNKQHELRLGEGVAA